MTATPAFAGTTSRGGAPEPERSLMSVCIVAAQLVMMPVAMWVGAKADSWGRKPIFAAALAVLALRGALYPLSDNSYWLVGVQALDGIGAEIVGALFPLVVADLTRGTGTSTSARARSRPPQVSAVRS